VTVNLTAAVLSEVIPMLLDLEVHGRHAKALGRILDMLITLDKEVKREEAISKAASGGE
jgi:hypothetical protein